MNSFIGIFQELWLHFKNAVLNPLTLPPCIDSSPSLIKFLNTCRKLHLLKQSMYLIFISKILSTSPQRSINNSFNLPMSHICLFMYSLCTVNKTTLKKMKISIRASLRLVRKHQNFCCWVDLNCFNVTATDGGYCEQYKLQSVVKLHKRNVICWVYLSVV